MMPLSRLVQTRHRGEGASTGREAMTAPRTTREGAAVCPDQIGETRVLPQLGSTSGDPRTTSQAVRHVGIVAGELGPPGLGGQSACQTPSGSLL